ncbi:PilZ domain-containing protein [Arsukibacterium tuosuense]|uniref:PilZ domain-containing protein n=1 Tax=Arsukibacterium tuosuense TaxID=1323745 RepID=A0A285IF76_9GAMM|nr:PilZ domain-containing protein [Arsukibacterium tuosuense]SNY46602.1 PilZ domain-containing protein [Arsukibacterium tuosuense]
MTAEDLKEYVGVIERMKSLMNSAEFDQVFSLLTSDLPKSKQFLLKMELKRMAQPCDYFIDLRGHVDGEVRPFVYREKTHYMDDKAIQIFENGIKQYGGYTLGVYEEVMNADNNFRVMHKKETAQRVKSALQTNESGDDNSSAATPGEQGAAKLVTFGHYVNRTEERMNFGIDVEVKINDSRFVATTSDLSISGCKLKIPKGRTAEPGDTVTINFTGLEQEFTLDIPQGIQYTLVDVEQLDKVNYWRLKKLPTEQDQNFSNFLEKFIHGNKRRYKVNLDNTTDAVTTKGYEQFYLPRLNSLPVYLAVNEGAVSPRFALTTDYNKSVWHYFLDEQQRSVLITLLSVKRLKPLLAQPGPERSTILYCFTHAAKGKLYYYSATAEELLAAPELRDTFFGFGATKPSWRVFHLNLIKTTAQHATATFTLPKAQQKTEQAEAKPVLSPLVQGVIKNLRYIASLTDISANNAVNYQQYNYNPANLSQLNQFGHRKLAQVPPCEAIPVQYINLRAESRYLYKTTVQLHQNEQMVAGFSRDFSTGGLQIETVEPVKYNKGDIVQLDLVDLQKITSKHQLTQLPYEVMAVSKSHTIMNLRALPTEDGHTGKQFFQQLIQNNRAKLTLAEETPKYPGLSEALRSMYLKALNNFAFYLHRKGIRYELNVIAQGATPNALHTLLLQHSKNGPLDLELLLKNSTANLQFAQQLKAMKRFDPPKSYELYIKAPRTTATSAASLESYYDYEFDNEQQKQAFITNTLREATLFAFRLFLSRTGRPDTDYIAREISYISVYAIHRAKTLEEELWSVAGVGDAVDISKELAWRYGCLEHVDDTSLRQQQLRDSRQS